MLFSTLPAKAKTFDIFPFNVFLLRCLTSYQIPRHLLGCLLCFWFTTFFKPVIPFTFCAFRQCDYVFKVISVFFLHTRSQPRGGSKIAPLKPRKVSLFTMIFYNSENSTCDIRQFCRPLFCHRSVVKYTLSLLQ